MLALIFAGCAAPSEHLFRVFRDLDELHTPPERTAPADGRGRRLSAHTHSATVDLADTRLELTYDAVAHERHALRLLEPALAPHIHSIHCANATHVRVRGDASLPALLADRLRDGGGGGIVMTGACTSEEEPTASRPFYCRVARVAARCDTCGEITLETEPIGLHDAFDSLKLAFRWSPPRTRTPRAQAAPPPPPPPQQQHAGRRRLFLSKIGDALNDLGEGLVDAGGKLLDKAGKVASGLVGAITGGVGGALDGMGDSLPEAVKGHWESLVDTLKAFFDGFSLHVEPSLNLLSLNFDNATGGAANASLPLFHTQEEEGDPASAWATCEGCYFHSELRADLEIEFAPGGVPQLFHAEVGGRIAGRAFLKAESPAPAVANDMGNWHNIVPRVHLGAFTFTVGYVPVQIDVYAELNGAAWAEEALPSAIFTMGVQVEAEASFGVHWDAAGGWRKVQTADWNHTFWRPAWQFGGANGSVRAAISPEIILSVWRVVPLEVKPKVIVGAHFGDAADAIPDERPGIDLPLAATSALFESGATPLRNQLGGDGGGRRRSLQAPADACAAGEAYALSNAVNIGIGIEDVRLPTSVLDALPGVDSGGDGLLIAGGVDFGEAVLLPEAGFPECGALCRGCLSTYERDREQLEAEAYGASYDHTDYDLKHPLAAALADWAVALIVVAVLVAAAVIAAVAARAVAWACPEFVARHPRLCVLQRCCCGGGGGTAKHDTVELQRFAAEHGAPTGWTEAEVAVFFNEIGLGRYRRQLAKNAVDGATLCDIVASGGLRDLGVTNIVHQARIRRRLACAGADGSSKPGAALPPPPPPPPSEYQQALARTAPVAANRRFSGRL